MSSNDRELALRNKALLQRHFDAINSWDFAAMREIFHPAIKLELPFVVDPFPKSVEGFDNVMAFMESVPEFAEEENLYDFTISSFAEDPNELVAEYVSDMKLKSGREYKNTYVVRVTIKDGKMVRFREYFDGIKLLESMGGHIVPPENS